MINIHSLKTTLDILFQEVNGDINEFSYVKLSKLKQI